MKILVDINVILDKSKIRGLYLGGERVMHKAPPINARTETDFSYRMWQRIYDQKTVAAMGLWLTLVDDARGAKDADGQPVPPDERLTRPAAVAARWLVRHALVPPTRQRGPRPCIAQGAAARILAAEEA